MASLCMTLLSYTLVYGDVLLVAHGRDIAASLPTPAGEVSWVQERLQEQTDTGNSAEQFVFENEPEISNDLEEGRHLEITPSMYTTMFGNSIHSLNAALVLLTNTTNSTTVEGVYGRHNHLISMAVSMLAALCSGIAAIISVILVPLRVGNQILVIIALALLAVYIIEDKHVLKNLGSNYQYRQEPVYSSNYGYNGASSLYRNDLLEEDFNEPGLGEEEVLKEEKENEEGDEEEEEKSPFRSYNENANSLRDLINENNGIDEAEMDADFAFRKYHSPYAQRQK